MFNKTFLTVEKPGPSHVTVHEHRAPTDASIALYDEMLKKARAEIVSQIAAPHDNVLSHATVEANYRLDTMQPEYFVVFRLNGEVFKERFKIEYGPREAMARAITRELVGHIGRFLERSLPRQSNQDGVAK